MHFIGDVLECFAKLFYVVEGISDVREDNFEKKSRTITKMIVIRKPRNRQIQRYGRHTQTIPTLRLGKQTTDRDEKIGRRGMGNNSKFEGFWKPDPWPKN